LSHLSVAQSGFEPRPKSFQCSSVSTVTSYTADRGNTTARMGERTFAAPQTTDNVGTLS